MTPGIRSTRRARSSRLACQRLLCLHLGGDLLDRAFVAVHAAVRTTQHMGVLADPDALARLLAVDLGDEADHPAVALEQALELGAAVRVHVPLAGDVLHQRMVLGLAVAAIEPHQRRVGPQHAAIGCRAVGAYGQELEQRAEIVVVHEGSRWPGRQCSPPGDVHGIRPAAEGAVNRQLRASLPADPGPRRRGAAADQVSLQARAPPASAAPRRMHPSRGARAMARGDQVLTSTS
jgi:hypothetical protein